jgi:hypothetical protein
MSENKCVIVLNENLSLGQLVNSAAFLMKSIGKLHPDLVGRNLEDSSGHVHQGITTILDKAQSKKFGLRQSLGIEKSSSG